MTRIREALKESPLAMMVAVTFVFVLIDRWQSRITACDGLGFDGCIYGGWARDFYGNVVSPGLSEYYTQRVLPAATVHYLIRLMRVVPTTPTIVGYFVLVNEILVSLTALSFAITTRKLKVSAGLRWLGAVCIFGNYAILTWFPFNPVLTDAWAFAFGMFQLHAYVYKRSIPLALVSILGAFAWPTLSQVGALLLFSQGMARKSPSRHRPAPLYVNQAIALLLSCGWTYCCVSLIRHRIPVENGATPICEPLIRLSMVVSVAAVYWSTRALLNDRRLFEPLRYLRALLTVPGILAPLVLFLPRILRKLITATNSDPVSMSGFFSGNAYSALQAPGQFLVAHVVFFGPIVLVVFLRWGAWVRVLQGHGTGLTLITLLAVVLGLNSETRKLINFFPMWIPFVLLLLQDLQVEKKKLALLAGVTLFSSRIWMDISLPGWAHPAALSTQASAMTMGPWMDFTMYLAQGLVVLAITYWIVGWLPKAQSLKAQP